ncbi:MAG: hypothetical protein GX592_11650 [Clostridiales bacterium]|nr:hypothetical protein [Clostridiales bacterium]
MKKFRPCNAGYILIYAIVVLCAADAVRSLLTAGLGGGDSFSNTFLMWSLLILPFALMYAFRYYRTVVEISQTHVRLVRPALIDPKPGEKRTNFIFRQGERDLLLIARTFELEQLQKYAYIEDFGLKPEDKGGAKQTGKLFPLHEVAFVMKDGKNCRFNAAIYSKKQQREIFQAIREKTGVEPTGKLAEALSEN